MPFPTDGLPDVTPMLNAVPVRLRTGAHVPLDVLLATWGIICHLNEVARTSLMFLVAGRVKDVPVGAKCLFRGLDMLDSDDRVLEAVAAIVKASVQAVRGPDRSIVMEWCPPAEGMVS